MSELIPVERIESKIFLIRGQQIMLDRDLAELYEVETKVLTRAVRRNLESFPDDFMFQLNYKEFTNLKRHFGASNWGGTRKLPLAFTRNGVAMLSSVLRSRKARQVNIQIMRVFTRVSQLFSMYEELKQAIYTLAEKEEKDVTMLFMEIDRLDRLLESKELKKQIGFKRE